MYDPQAFAEELNNAGLRHGSADDDHAASVALRSWPGNADLSYQLSFKKFRMIVI
jgi:hypothetical protein